ncbi:MAG TPA: hypothetical protein VLT13_06785, partial [Bacteroidota bacterium]|nr:hypothetical protein [Bacteroidota bacterium]
MTNRWSSTMFTGGWRRAAILVWCTLLLTPPGARAQHFWDLFSTAYTTNVLAWTRHNDNPVIGPSGSTWKGHGTGSPEFLAFQGRTFLFYRGNGVLPGKGKTAYDRIGVAEVLDIGTMRLKYRDLNKGFPVVDIGSAGEFDDAGAQTPAAVAFKGQIYLYYSAVGKGPNSIGLAVSTDGEQFKKIGRVLEGRGQDVLVVRDTLYMIYQKVDPAGHKVYLAYSLDGKKFTAASEHPVFSGAEGRWDAKSISTPRIWESGGVYYILYGGSTDYLDEPEFFGLARSK